jgi:hypothetical protein
VAAYDPDRVTGQPEGVRVVIAGRAIPCDMLRDPDLDHDGIAFWVAVPREPVIIAAGSDCQVLADMLPARTALVVRTNPPSRSGPPAGPSDGQMETGDK